MQQAGEGSCYEFLLSNGLATKTSSGNIKRNDRLVKLLRNISFGMRKRKRRFE